MAVIGNLGTLITFEVSSDKVLTLQKMSRTVKGRWARHEIIGKKPQSEFLGADLQGISFSVLLSVNHGVNPRVTLERIASAVEKGENFLFVLGGKAVGENKWKIVSVSESWDVIMKEGILVQAKVTISLEEYV